ncbi:MAG: HEAT repeat domain-containing protein [Candidatus Omnitrophota bacterium]|nr:HEAT repeat domain-containing protein [Candidatus Omnitrophota bacterium]
MRKINIILIFTLIGVFLIQDISYALRVPLGIYQGKMARYIEDRIEILEKGGSGYPGYKKALGELRGLGDVAVPYLLETLKDKKFEVSGSAAEVLSYIAASMKSKEEREERDKIVRALIDYLMEYDGETYKIMDTLEQLLLVNGLSETDIFTINFFNRSVNMITFPRNYPLIEKAKKQMPILRKLLKHRAVTICLSAVRLARDMGSEAKEVLPEIRTLAKNTSPEYYLIPIEAIALLGEIGRDAESAMPDLRAALRDNDSEVRKEAARSIGMIGGIEAKNAVPELIQALKTGNVFAAEALGKIKAESAIPVLKQCSKSEDLVVAKASRTAIKEIGKRKHRVNIEASRAFTGINVAGEYMSPTRAVLVKKESDVPTASSPVYILVAKDGGSETAKCALIGYQRGNMKGIITVYGGKTAHLGSIVRSDMPWIVYISGLDKGDFYKTVKTGDMLELDDNKVTIVRENFPKSRKRLPQNKANRSGV